MTRLEPTREVLFVRYRKGDERYVFCGTNTPENVRELFHVFGMFAHRKDLSFSWGDAAMLSKRLHAETTT